MVIEIDSGVWIETQDMNAVMFPETGVVTVVVSGQVFTVTRFTFEQMLDLLRQREAQKTDLAY